MTHLFHLGAKALPPQFLVIFLHGFGANGANLLDLSFSLEKELPSAIFLAPNGFDTLSEYGPDSYQWFDLDEMTPTYIRQKCAEVVGKGVKLIRSLQEKHGIPAERTILIGFSQGTMMSLAIALSEPNLCKAVIGCAGGLYMEQSSIKASTENLKILLIHGDKDDIVPLEESQSALEVLKNQGFQASLAVIPGLDHSIDEGVLMHMKNFLKGFTV